MALSASAIEVIQSQNEAELIKSNTRKFNAEYAKEIKDNEIYIPNPIDRYFEKKNEGISAEPEAPSSVAVDCDEMDFNHETNELEAKGHVIIITSPEKNQNNSR